jgi:hypothetical protein
MADYVVDLMTSINGRKTLTVTIKEGRDAGKKFLITERPCIQTEHWIMRAIFGLGKAGVELPPELLQLGAAPIAYAIATQAIKLPSRLGIRLADELMQGVERVEEKLTRSLVDNDIEDVSTRLQLKAEVMKLTFGFFVPAASQSSAPPGSGTPSSKPSTSPQ